MNKENVIRAWKDKDFRNSLTEDELNSLPSNPAGMIDISDMELEMASGGNVASTEHFSTLGCCNGYTSEPRFCNTTLTASIILCVSLVNLCPQLPKDY